MLNRLSIVVAAAGLGAFLLSFLIVEWTIPQQLPPYKQEEPTEHKSRESILSDAGKDIGNPKAHKEGKNEGHWYNNFWEHLPEWGLFIITGGVVWVGWYQVRTTRAQLRAHLVVEGTGIRPFSAKGSICRYAIKNVGQMPATQVEWVVHSKFGPGTSKTFDIDWDIKQGEWTVAPGLVMHRSFDFKPTEFDIEGFKKRMDVLYVWGKISYKDGFRRKKRWTRFCHRYGLGKDIPIPLDPAEDGREEITPDRMRYHQYGNETDES